MNLAVRFNAWYRMEKKRASRQRRLMNFEK